MANKDFEDYVLLLKGQLFGIAQDTKEEDTKERVIQIINSLDSPKIKWHYIFKGQHEYAENDDKTQELFKEEKSLGYEKLEGNDDAVINNLLNIQRRATEKCVILQSYLSDVREKLYKVESLLKCYASELSPELRKQLEVLLLEISTICCKENLTGNDN